MRKKAARVSDLLDEVLSSQGLRSVALLSRLGSSWPDIVGRLLFGKTSPARLRAGVLTVTVVNHSWAQELQMRKQELLERIGRAVGEGEVTDIRFQAGPLPDVDPGEDEAGPTSENIAAGPEPEGISSIPDPETREILRAVARKAASRKP